MTTILAADALRSFGAVTMTITGEADWDTYLFSKIKDKTYTEDQAKALWTYTDGYKVTIKASNAAEAFNPQGLTTTTALASAATGLNATPTWTGSGVIYTERRYQLGCLGDVGTADTALKAAVASGTTAADLGVKACPAQTAQTVSKAALAASGGTVATPCQYCRQTLCVTKSAAANSSVNRDDWKENAGRAADGYYCFEMDRARMDFMQYWKTADFATTGMVAGKTAQWEVNYKAGRAVDRVGLATEDAAAKSPSNPYNNQAAIFPSAGNTASIVPAVAAVPLNSNASLEPAYTGALRKGQAQLSVSWYQPKW